jgi:hypothetical protein
MNQEEMLESFAEKIANEVRDVAIRQCDRYNEGPTSPGLRNPIAEAKQLTNSDELVRMVIPFVVDTVIGRLLIAIEGGVLPLVFYDEFGSSLDLSIEFAGELSGWWGCESEEWIGKYSKQRCIDLLKKQ